jgi:hypothetical protein
MNQKVAAPLFFDAEPEKKKNPYKNGVKEIQRFFQ